MPAPAHTCGLVSCCSHPSVLKSRGTFRGVDPRDGTSCGTSLRQNPYFLPIISKKMTKSSKAIESRTSDFFRLSECPWLPVEELPNLPNIVSIYDLKWNETIWYCSKSDALPVPTCKWVDIDLLPSPTQSVWIFNDYSWIFYSCQLIGSLIPWFLLAGLSVWSVDPSWITPCTSLHQVYTHSHLRFLVNKSLVGITQHGSEPTDHLLVIRLSSCSPRITNDCEYEKGGNSE